MRCTRNRLLAAVLALALLAVPSASWSQNSPFPISVSTQLQAAVAATGNGTALSVNQMQVATIQVSGTFTATVSFQGSSDGTNYQALTCYTLDSNTSATSASAAGIWRCNVGGLQLIRTPVTWSSGTSVTVWATASSAGGPIRDVTSASGAITGPLRGTQTTAPTCGMANMLGTMSAGNCTVVGTDSFMVGGLGGGFNTGGLLSNTNLVVTFNTAYAAAPTCVAQYNQVSANGNTIAATGSAYGYYFYAVTPTTTTVTLKLGRVLAMLTPAAAAWSPFDSFNIICAGTQ